MTNKKDKQHTLRPLNQLVLRSIMDIIKEMLRNVNNVVIPGQLFMKR